MRARRWCAFAVLIGLVGTPLRAQQYTETSVPLQDPQVNAWLDFGDIVLAVDYRGNDKVTAFINAYSLSEKRFLYHREVDVQQKRQARGRYAMADHGRNILYLGNGPLSALDVTTGEVKWSLTCRQVGSVDLETAELMDDGNLVIAGSKDCGEGQERRVMLIDDKTGAIRWSVTANAYDYKTGNTEHRDFTWVSQRDAASGAYDRIILAGERLQAVRYADGTPAWQVRGDAGRLVDARAGMMTFVNDKKLTAYRLSDGAVAWTLKIDAPWAVVIEVPGSDDVLFVTYYAAFRVDPRTGTQRWTARRSMENWSRWHNPPFLYMKTDDDRWGAYDLATGAKRWEFHRDEGSVGYADTALVIDSTHVALFVGADKYDNPSETYQSPYVLWGVEAATGAVRWKLKAVNGNRISDYEPLSDAAVAVQEQRSGQWSIVDVASGSVTLMPTEAVASGGACQVRYLERKKTLSCVTAGGTTVWTRRGPESDRKRFFVDQQHGIVVWPAEDGTVEIIRAVDGTSLFRTTADKNPSPVVTGDRRYLLVPAGRTLKIIALSE